jgi:hypothetical protein
VSYFSSTSFLGLHFALFLRSFSWSVALSTAAPRSPRRWLRLILITDSCASFFHATGLHLTSQSALERSQGSWRCEQTVGAGGAVSIGRIWDGTRKYGTPVEVFPSFFLSISFALLFSSSFRSGFVHGFRESVLPFFFLIYFVSLFSFPIWILHGLSESDPCRFLICGHGGATARSTR